MNILSLLEGHILYLGIDADVKASHISRYLEGDYCFLVVAEVQVGVLSADLFFRRLGLAFKLDFDGLEEFDVGFAAIDKESWPD